MAFHRIILVLLLMALLAGVSAAEPMPQLDTDQSEFDFGDVFQGDTVTHTFVFTNTGEAPLIIDRLKSSCGCTAALLSSKNIPPGGQGTIKTTFDSSRFRGKVRKIVFLYSNLPGTDVSQFVLQGTVKPLVDYEPQAIDFGAVKVGETKELSVVLTNRGDNPLLIENVRASNTALTGRPSADQLLPGQPLTVTVTASPKRQHVHLKGYLLVRTDFSALGEVRVPVKGTVEK